MAMRSNRWKFWGYIVRRLARSQGFLDPVTALSQLQRFAQPSEVWVPTELLRFGAVMQVRGLINSQAIQHNRDWLWPYWVKRQFDPKDVSFIPRAFSLAHINLTHRNWTALGIPSVDKLSLVDPRGLVTPLYDGWSIDSWLISQSGPVYFPAAAESVRQRLTDQPGVCVETASDDPELQWRSWAEVVAEGDEILCRIRYRVKTPDKSWLVVGLRPYNPEGISFINEIQKLEGREGWRVNDEHEVRISDRPSQYIFSDYAKGDVCRRTINPETAADENKVLCSVGMATAAGLFAVPANETYELSVTVPLERAKDHKPYEIAGWAISTAGTTQIQIPDKHIQRLFETAAKMLILHSPGDIYPGPYTYRRFWFRDAVFIMDAMLSLGLASRVERVLERFPARQTAAGHMLSQDGEWDSNGQVLWILRRYCQVAHVALNRHWLPMIHKAARWINRKRATHKKETPHRGLMPAGFSAEHFGPNDFYYWDDFWSLAGLHSYAWMLERTGEVKASHDAQKHADELSSAINRSLELTSVKLGHQAIPASPYRRMDAGAIGSLAAGYPLSIWPEQDSRLTETVQYLMNYCFLKGGFYQEISHSGINAYLTLHVAQTLLRAGNPHFFDVVKAVAALASDTGQWPEAIHPRTGGGCMGDGMHVWASAEWILMLRNMFVREDSFENKLILLSGVPPEWLQGSEPLRFGPVHTVYGRISLTLNCLPESVQVEWTAEWHENAPTMEIRLPGTKTLAVEPHVSSIEIRRAV